MEKKIENCSTIYYQNGTKCSYDITLMPPQDEFFIQIWHDREHTRFYPGDTLIRQIIAELALLGEHFRPRIMPDDAQYYSECAILPVFISQAGLSSNYRMSRENYESLLKGRDFQNWYKPHLYLAEVQYLISSVQNLVIGMEANLIDFYKMLSEIPEGSYLNFPTRESTTIVIMGENAERITSVLGSYFVKLYSIMDLITKITYEFENPCAQFDSFVRLRSNTILYNNKNRLKLNNRESTLFVKDDMLTEIETIRNEIVHNGTWEDGGRVFIDIENEMIKACYVMYPDMVNGRFVSYANRHHFFSNGIRVNDILPKIHAEFSFRLFQTIRCIQE